MRRPVYPFWDWFTSCVAHSELTLPPAAQAGTQMQQVATQNSWLTTHTLLLGTLHAGPHIAVCDPCSAHSPQFTLMENFGFSLFTGPQLFESFDCFNDCS